MQIWKTTLMIKSSKNEKVQYTNLKSIRMTKSIQKWKNTVYECKKKYANDKKYARMKKYSIIMQKSIQMRKSMRKWKSIVYECKKVYEF